MKRALWCIPPVVLIVILFALGFGKDPSSVPSPLVDRTAPAFSLHTPTGKRISLDQLKGRPVIMNFFASWCVACHDEQPILKQAYQKWGKKAAFVGVVFEDSSSAATSWLRSNGGHWPVVVDPGGRAAVNYGVTGIPETFFITKAGRIAYKALYLTPGRLRRGMRHILAGA